MYFFLFCFILLFYFYFFLFLYLLFYFILFIYFITFFSVVVVFLFGFLFFVFWGFFCFSLSKTIYSFTVRWKLSQLNGKSANFPECPRTLFCSKRGPAVVPIAVKYVSVNVDVLTLNRRWKTHNIEKTSIQRWLTVESTLFQRCVLALNRRCFNVVWLPGTYRRAYVSSEESD